jgi:hypothetical protein
MGMAHSDARACRREIAIGAGSFDGFGRMG